MQHRPVTFNIPSAARLTLLFLCYFLGLLITAVLSSVLLGAMPAEKHAAALRIGAVIQDVFALAIPAVATAVLATRNPAGLLAVDRRPGAVRTVIALITILVAAPVMSRIIEWNASITFPESLASLETALRGMESNAASAISAMTATHTVGNLIVNILIIGVMAGFCEELFFRGALQRLLSATALGGHGAVWLSAFIFSLVHFQFFGFVPRLLIGAYMGYLLLWSGSLWLPVCVHIFNNTMFVLLEYLTGSGDPQVGTDSTVWIIAAASALLAAVGLVALHAGRRGKMPSNRP